MYSDKKNVLQLVALLKAYGIRYMVLSPGSRNSPVVHSLVVDPFFPCYTVVDERSAGFLLSGSFNRSGNRWLSVVLPAQQY